MDVILLTVSRRMGDLTGYFAVYFILLGDFVAVDILFTFAIKIEFRCCARISEMVTAMKNIAVSNIPLNVEERNLLSVAYKNVIGARRASWRIVSSVVTKEQTKMEEGGEVSAKLKMMREYRNEIEEELQNICKDILDLLDNHLIPCSQDQDATVFYYKM